MRQLENRTAVVTGGAGFLGASFCRSLALEGADVYVLDSNRQQSELVAQLIGSEGLSARSTCVDVTDEQQLREFFESLSRLDIVVNSAAIDPKVDSDIPVDSNFEVDSSGFLKAIEVSLLGTYLSSMLAIKKVGPSHPLSIVNISSTYGLVAPDQRLYGYDETLTFFKPAHYSASKAGVIGLTSYFASFCRNTLIRVNALVPGGVRLNQDGEFVKRYSDRTILGRMAEPEDISGALVFLASEASRYMTGTTLVVDGGWTTC